MTKNYNLEALNNQKEDIEDKVQRLQAQLVLVETAIKRGLSKQTKSVQTAPIESGDNKEQKTKKS